MVFQGGRSSYVQIMSAITVPSGSIADVYWSAKGKVTFVRVLAGNLHREQHE